MNKNSLTIRSIKQKARVGCTEEERTWPQFLRFDITLHLDMSRCMVSDNLKDTVDYMLVLDVLNRVCEEREWKLIEKMCADIGNAILEECPQLSAVTMRTLKNIAEHADGVECELTVNR